MKLRWRQHELILITTLVLCEMVLILFSLEGPFGKPIQHNVKGVFAQNGLAFAQYLNFILPQVGSILLIFVIYLAVNFWTLPLLKKLNSTDFEKILSTNTIKGILSIVVVSITLLKIIKCKR